MCFGYLEPSVYLAKALCLRGTMYTLMSMHTEALNDFDRVIDLEEAVVKVTFSVFYTFRPVLI